MQLLLAIDGSSGADNALTLVAASFRPTDITRIDVAIVVPSGAADTAYRWTGLDPHEAASAVVTAARARLAAAGFHADDVVLAGHPAAGILDHAAASGAHLIVLGTRGLGGLGRILAGSVSAKVARYAPVPVLVVSRVAAIRRILVACDGSVASNTALDFAATLPLANPPSFVVFTAYDVPAPLSSGIAPTMLGRVEATYRDSLVEARQQAESTAREAAARLAAQGHDATTAVMHGSPLGRVALVAEREASDLIVVGDRGRSGIERFLLGSTSAGLVAAPPTSILVVRGSGATAGP